MEEILSELKSVALSDKQVEKMSGAKMLLYADLYKYETLKDLLDKNNGRIILLYLSKNDPSFGHWTCLFKTVYGDKDKRECVEFMDSYGYKPDEEFSFSSNKHGQDFKYLSLLMKASDYLLTYNEHKFQGSKGMINTCGWHVCNRIDNSDKTLTEYKKMLDRMIKECHQLKNYDDVVVVMLYDKYKKVEKLHGGFLIK